ncbi:DUF11 domain-containing protein [Sphingorhabdus pulchriflava]|uniref:DUF11 domain-containing protein n=1 Tax=Sphingorhabdus pulchriflava TaxID=2292257 RepID=A0A371BHX8_9SPHN|nr:DUF11 domain-containing protein [Sphingorhabdus pulchriflava]RDV06981.1 DUF11 domain-containing protein [Sphingorhabdus pulchriflava]
MALTKHLIKRAGMLAAAAHLAAACLPAHAQVLPNIISNTAQAEWTSGGQPLSRPSNSVDIVVDRSNPQPAALEVFRFTSASGSTQAVLPQTMCRGTNGLQPVNLQGVFAGLSTNPASISPASSIRAGEPLVLKVTASGQNSNPGAIDSFEAEISTDTGDVERITLTETGANTSVFLALVNTKAAPPAAIQGDCVLSVRPGDQLHFDLDNAQNGNPIAGADVDILVDPFGLTFDSADGTAVDGTRVTIVDAATGQPAQVFGDDGVSSFPSTIIAGSTVTDGGGQIYTFPSGFYRFPFLRQGTYRLIITPPAPYTHPSVATPAELALLTRPDGGQFVIADGSYGGIITLNDPAPVRIDVPMDRPGGSLQLRKSTSSATAMPGDVVQYRIEVRNPDRVRNSGPITVTDILPASMRLRLNSVRYNGTSVTPVATADGSEFSVVLPPLAGGASGLLTYLAEVRVDARSGDAVNRASARDNRGATSDTAEAAIRIIRDGISERFTIVGRITEGGCSVDPRKAKGISGVRVMLEDGSYAITDIDGRYHFEGVVPGLHVVQVDPSTFPLDQAPVDCAQNTRSAGSAISRFVEGRGGSLKRADFRSTQVSPRREAIQIAPKPVAPNAEERSIAGGEKDWVAGQAPGLEFLFPGTDHNPPVPAIRVAIKHAAGQRIELSANGKVVDPLNFDGAKRSGDGRVNVSIWRGVPIVAGNNALVARVLNSEGQEVAKLERQVHFATPAIQAQFLKEKSLLLADGVNRPRIAVRFTDRSGKPIQPDAVGDFSVTEPYRPAVEIDAQQASQLSGLERAAPVWRVVGEDGVAYIELEPTTASGAVAISFNFQDGQVKRTQRIETWLDPGDRPWTVVGFAAGTLGFNKLEEGLQDLAGEDDQLNVDGRIALYAKGRVTGKWLMTMAYDSDKKADDARFAGTIDPRRYYTVYADRSEQRYDAASIRRLYLKLERPQFYALFGDYQTGIDEPELARYQRSFNGIKAEYRSDEVHAQAFAADTPYRYRREEIQGTGLTGPYALATRDILANSERITIETRDRLQSNIIIDRKTLVRHIDYDIDYLAGTLRFREPILSRSSGLNPQFIIAEYEVDGVGKRVNNAGGRMKWQSPDQKLQIAATAIHDETDTDKTNLVGADVRYRPTANTELRAEFAATDGKANAGSTTTDAGGASAVLLEAEHHGAKLDVLAYYRRQSARFGVGQTNRSEVGTEKFGLDGRYRLTDKLSISAIGYQEDYIETGARRIAGSTELEYRNDKASLRAGITHADDKLADGTTNKSTLARIAGSYKLTSKLELDAQTEFALGGEDESIDFPARHRLGARYAIRNDIALVGSYEIAKGENIDARTARIGFDIAPWAGGRIVASANQQDIGEFGARSFASYGLAQSFKINDKWSVDFTLDGNQTIGGFDRSDVINPLQPVASGGFLGSDGTLTEDFVAVTGGASYHGERWSWTGRAEWRDGDTTQRYGLTTAILRQIGEGKAVGGALNWFKAKQDGGASTTTAQAEISWANRPSGSQWSFLNKTEYRYDSVKNATAGLPGPVGGAPLLVSGDVKSTRIINSLSVNYTPIDERDGSFIERGEYAFFWGTRYNTDRFGADDVKGWSNVVGADLRFDFSDIADVGISGTARIGTSGKNIFWSGGPTLTVTPFDNSNVTLGYNFVGFEDRDFEEARYTRSGPFLTFKLKFDQTSFQGLGL